MPKMNSQKWIDSSELLDKCEITKPTLEYYIKLGIVPRPVVRNSEDGLTGYFPPEVIDTIDKVRQLKDEGETMEEIVKKVKNPPEERNYNNDIESKRIFFEERAEKIIKDKIGADSRGLHLTLVDINTPAYLMNYQFEVEWINEQAESVVFGKNIKTIRDVEYRNVFRLFLNWEFTNFIKNWEEFLHYHMIFFKARQPKEQIEHLYSNISQKEIGYLQKVYDNTESVALEKIYQQFITLIEKDKPQERYIVYTTFFREGMFFLYLPADSVPTGITEYLSNRELLVRELLQQRLPSLVSFSVLVADLQGSVRICAELPPEEYFELINAMWKLLEESFKKFNGIFGKKIGDGVVYYFLKKQDPHYIMNSINCALEIRERMSRFSIDWKLRKKWYNDLYLNIGINEGQEYFSTTTPSSTNIEFTALGDTINYASRLSNLARYGSIITTKNLMNQLDEGNKKDLRFGVVKRINERDVFVEKVFSQVIDLVKEDEARRERFADIAALPVTEILE
jgi:adenylate cyclase